MMKKVVILLFLGIANQGLLAQDLSADFYSYYQNLYAVNPAISGTTEFGTAILNSRYIGGGVPGSPINLMAGVYMPLNSSQSLGGRIISDSRGPFGLVKGDLTYAYSVNFQNNNKLVFGISGGFLNRNFSSNRIENFESLDNTDPNLQAQYNNSTRFVAGSGVAFKNEKLKITTSLPHFVEANQKPALYSFSTAGYTFTLGKKNSIEPWGSFLYMQTLGNIYGGYLKGKIVDRFILQVGYLSNQTMNFSASVDFSFLNVGYSYQMPNTQLRNVNNGNHQVFLAFKFKKSRTRINLADEPEENLINLFDRLNKVLTTQSNSESIEEIKFEIQQVRTKLKEAEVLNQDPKNEKEVHKMLKEISSQINQLEKKYGNK
ncbi:MAG: PorP/SprF family type IX secretion system membrane protein [Bacteroidetes bacterium]|nr:PorP/SprF family type IX secretion system membrane protein [Bacteroidota bacterium]